MKKVVKVVLSLVLIMSLSFSSIMMNGASSRAAYTPGVDKLFLAGLSQNSVTITWNPPTGSYQTSIVKYRIYLNEIAINETTATSYTYTGLYGSTKYTFSVSAIGSDGTESYQTYLTEYTAPSMVGAVVPSYCSASTGSVSFKIAPITGADGHEVELATLSGKVYRRNTSTGPYSSYIDSVMKKNTPTVVRYRAFRNFGGQRVYGPYSAVKVYLFQKLTVKARAKLFSKVKTVTVKWSKVSGATNYTVYAKKGINGAWKKVKTLGKKGRSVKITKVKGKKLARYSTYYFKVVPKVKVAGKKYTATPLVNYYV